jgi:hypothetical protein
MKTQASQKQQTLITTLYAKLLSEHTKERCERVIVSIAIISFVAHLLLIVLVDSQIIRVNDPSSLLTNPIAAIYTPFSFILVYEVYLLVYYLPKSITTYIGKQYEIITLIVIRRIFKDLANLEFTQNWFTDKNDLQFTYDLLATVILFFLIFLFYRLSEQKPLGKVTGPTSAERTESDRTAFDKTNPARLKRIIAVCLIPVLLVLAVYSFSHWVQESFFSLSQLVKTSKDINKIFFDDFFTVLILTDVLLLLVSFLYTDQFRTVIRNSGFIISTILIKLSFGSEGILSTVLVVVAVLFGVLILGIHNQHETVTTSESA